MQKKFFIKWIGWWFNTRSNSVFDNWGFRKNKRKENKEFND